jgi:hypothetical protein
MLNWPDMPEFQHVEITDCFVLSWGETDGDLVFTVEASLWPGHPRYTTPPKTQWTCYRKATLRFPGLKHVEGLLPMPKTQSATDPDGSVDYGTIDSLWREDDDSYRLYGDFGEVTIHSDALEFLVL